MAESRLGRPGDSAPDPRIISPAWHEEKFTKSHAAKDRVLADIRRVMLPLIPPDDKRVTLTYVTPQGLVHIVHEDWRLAAVNTHHYTMSVDGDFGVGLTGDAWIPTLHSSYHELHQGAAAKVHALHAKWMAMGRAAARHWASFRHAVAQAAGVQSGTKWFERLVEVHVNGRTWVFERIPGEYNVREVATPSSPMMLVEM